MANEVRLIDANALVRFIDPGHLRNQFELCFSEDSVVSMIRNAPTIDPESLRRKGRWIHCEGKSNLWYCSECGEKIQYNPTRRVYNIEKRPVHEVNKYCRSCGAIMEGYYYGICAET